VNFIEPLLLLASVRTIVQLLPNNLSVKPGESMSIVSHITQHASMCS